MIDYHTGYSTVDMTSRKADGCWAECITLYKAFQAVCKRILITKIIPMQNGFFSDNRRLQHSSFVMSDVSMEASASLSDAHQPRNSKHKVTANAEPDKQSCKVRQSPEVPPFMLVPSPMFDAPPFGDSPGPTPELPPLILLPGPRFDCPPAGFPPGPSPVFNSFSWKFHPPYAAPCNRLSHSI